MYSHVGRLNCMVFCVYCSGIDCASSLYSITSVAQTSKSKPSHSGTPSPSLSFSSTSPMLLSSNEPFPIGDDALPQEETYNETGE